MWQGVQLRAPAEGQHIARARRDARRPFALLQALVAERTLAHARRQGIVVLVGGDLEGARHHALPAADALPGVIGDGASRLLLQGADDASGDARRAIAVEA